MRNPGRGGRGEPARGFGRVRGALSQPDGVWGGSTEVVMELPQQANAEDVACCMCWNGGGAVESKSARSVVLKKGMGGGI